jgi:hypothetical protein
MTDSIPPAAAWSSSCERIAARPDRRAIVIESPRSLNPPVKSRVLNVPMKYTGLNDALDLWSLPWHELQRRLAQTCGAAGAWTAAAPNGVAPTLASAANWLARARLASMQAHQSGR